MEIRACQNEKKTIFEATCADENMTKILIELLADDYSFYRIVDMYITFCDPDRKLNIAEGEKRFYVSETEDEIFDNLSEDFQSSFLKEYVVALVVIMLSAIRQIVDENDINPEKIIRNLLDTDFFMLIEQDIDFGFLRAFLHRLEGKTRKEKISASEIAEFLEKQFILYPEKFKEILLTIYWITIRALLGYISVSYKPENVSKSEITFEKFFVKYKSNDDKTRWWHSSLIEEDRNISEIFSLKHWYVKYDRI